VDEQSERRQKFNRDLAALMRAEGIVIDLGKIEKEPVPF
jgi:hypothetical protein